jgi:hypothetical protein
MYRLPMAVLWHGVTAYIDAHLWIIFRRTSWDSVRTFPEGVAMQLGVPGEVPSFVQNQLNADVKRANSMIARYKRMSSGQVLGNDF